MEHKYDLSVVILVYNTAEYLRDCIDSIINQTMKNIEIIAVDDSSTDNSLEILKEYEHLENFKIIHQPNQGGAVAGNNGLKMATGKYVTLVDSDDILMIDSYEKLFSFAEKNECDVVIGTAKRLIDGYIVDAGIVQERNVWKEERIVEDVKAEVDIFYDGFYWNKIYRRELIINNDVFMPPGMLFADRPFVHKAFIHAKRVGIIPDLVYLWRHRGENAKQKSVLQSNAEKSNLEDRFNSLLYQYENDFSKLNDDEFANNWLKTYIVRNLLMANNIFGSPEYRDVYFEKMKIFLSKIDDVYNNDGTMIDNILIYLLLNDFREEFIHCVSVEPKGEILTEDNIKYWCLPFFRNEVIGVPDELYIVKKFQPNFIEINDLIYDDDKLIFRGFDYITEELVEDIKFVAKSRVTLDNIYTAKYDVEKNIAVFDLNDFDQLDLFDFYVSLKYGDEEFEVRVSRRMVLNENFDNEKVNIYFTNRGVLSGAIFNLSINELAFEEESIKISVAKEDYNKIDIYMVNREDKSNKIKMQKIEHSNTFRMYYSAFLSENEIYDIYCEVDYKSFKIPYNSVKNIKKVNVTYEKILLEVYPTLKGNMAFRSKNGNKLLRYLNLVKRVIKV